MKINNSKLIYNNSLVPSQNINLYNRYFILQSDEQSEIFSRFSSKHGKLKLVLHAASLNFHLSNEVITHPIFEQLLPTITIVSDN